MNVRFLSVQYSAQSLSQSRRQLQEIGESKDKADAGVSLFAADMIVIRKDPKNCQATSTDDKNGHSSWIQNIQKSVAFLHANDKLAEKEAQETIPLQKGKNKML